MTSALGPRVRLGLFPTPLQPIPEVPGLVIKRDDLSGFGWAGNKTRPLEYLIADALDTGSTCVVGGGMPDSTFIGALAEAACRYDLACHLLVPEPVTETTSLCLARLLGATVEPVSLPREDLDLAIGSRARALTAAGSPAYAVPRGGATPVGALGFCQAAAEVLEQNDGGAAATIVIPVGSGASLAGLIAGLALHGAPVDVVGVSVSRPLAEIGSTVQEMARAVMARVGGDPKALDDLSLKLIDARAGLDREATREATRAAARCGILMDGHYGLPAWDASLRLARDAADTAHRTLLWHTGGMAGVPGLLREVQGG